MKKKYYIEWTQKREQSTQQPCIYKCILKEKNVQKPLYTVNKSALILTHGHFIAKVKQEKIVNNFKVCIHVIS